LLLPLVTPLLARTNLWGVHPSASTTTTIDLARLEVTTGIKDKEVKEVGAKAIIELMKINGQKITPRMYQA